MSKELDLLKAKTKLPILSGVRVASPCTVEWTAMAPVDGGDQVRHCGNCKKNVYNLSSMTREEAETLLLAKEGRMCVRYYQRSDGTILLKDCMVAPSAAKRRLIAAGAAALLATASGAALLSRNTDERAMASNILSPTSNEEIPDNLKLSNVVESPPPAPVVPQHDPVTAVPHEFEPMQGDVAMPIDDIKGEL
jgi:hypothetical protein